ncbi:hypothetical protein, partial [Streptomyces oceani]|uniref:hypothetical protein n=1 Tax=Streptomyces oceani TaxID=1075402 RepID=UPI001BB0B6C3
PNILAKMCIKGTQIPLHNTRRETGVSTYLALTFGTLLSSQGTNTHIRLPLRNPPDVFSAFRFDTIPSLIQRKIVVQKARLGAPESLSALDGDR